MEVINLLNYQLVMGQNSHSLLLAMQGGKNRRTPSTEYICFLYPTSLKESSSLISRLALKPVRKETWKICRGDTVNYCIPRGQKICIFGRK